MCGEYAYKFIWVEGKTHMLSVLPVSSGRKELNKKYSLMTNSEFLVLMKLMYSWLMDLIEKFVIIHLKFVVVALKKLNWITMSIIR